MAYAAHEIEKPTFETHLCLTGWIRAQYVRCGKADCRCATGDLHGPYHYRVWREGGKAHKSYIRPDDIEDVRRAVAYNGEVVARLRSLRKRRSAIQKALRAQWAIAKSLIANNDALVGCHAQHLP